MARRAWATWKRFAHRAAQIQSAIVLSVLYWVIVAPAGLVRGRRRRAAPRWTLRPPSERVTLESARRQY